MSPEQWERTKAGLKDPEYDPHGVLPDDIWFEDLVRGEMSHQLNMSPEDSFEGRWWYPGAHESSRYVAEKTSGDHERTVAEWSAFSPKNKWDNNIENGIQFSMLYPGRPGKPYERSMELHGDPALEPPKNPGGPETFSMPAMNTDDAMKIRHAPGDSFKKFLTGPKRQAFFRNIMDNSKIRPPRPGKNPVDDSGYYEMPINPYTGEPDWRMHPQQLSTMDTQHVRMALTPHGTASDEQLANLEYKTPPYFSKKRVINGKVHEVGYELQHRAHWEATRRLNALQHDVQKHVVPMQSQAGPWLKFRKELDNAALRVRGEVPKEPGDLPQGIEPGRQPRRRMDHRPGIGQEGPRTEYDVTGIDSPTMENNKKHHLPRFQVDHGSQGDPDYSRPPESHGPERHLEVSDRYDTHHPQKKLPPGRRHLIPETGWAPTPRDPRNRVEDMRQMRNWNRKAKRFWSGIQDDKYPQHWMDKAEQLARETGGFSIHDDPNLPGDAPTSGYQVAIPGHEDDTISTGRGWADWAHNNQDVLRGNYMGTWNDGDRFITEPSERFPDYDEAARATLDRNQWAMWDNGAFRTDSNGKKNYLPQAEIPRTDIAQQGFAGATGFNLARRHGINYTSSAFHQVKRFWEG